MLATITYAFDNADTIISTATAVVTAASILTAATDTPKPDTWLGKLYKILEVLALVIGRAKDKAAK
jgi:hypothetical protein